MKNLKLTASALGALLCMSLAPVAQADQLQFVFNNAGIYTGAAPPVIGGDPNTVWAKLTFTDTGAGSTNVTMKMEVLSGVFTMPLATYVNDWWFNASTAGIAATATFLNGIEAISISRSSNGETGAGDAGKFDGLIQFDTSDKDLSEGEWSTYNFFNAGGLTINDFYFKSFIPGNNPDLTKAEWASVHVQGFGASGKSGACLPSPTNPQCPTDDEPPDPPTGENPEPASLALLGLGLGALAMSRRRRS